MPSATLVVRRPKDEVAISFHAVPEALPIRRLFAITTALPVPPCAAAKIPEEMFPAFNEVRPDPLPVNVFEPIFILPNPEPIEPDVSAPTVARFERLVILDVASEETRPFVENKRPLNELARVVVPDTLNVPVAVIFEVVAFPAKNASPATVSAELGVVDPIPTLPAV